MSGELRKQLIKSSGGGFFQDIGMRIKLILRLLRDRRVNLFLKLLPLSTLIYLVAPDFLPFIIDDALIIWLGTYLFVELCPDDIVIEHMNALTKKLHASESPTHSDEPDVVDGEYHEVKDPEGKQT